MGHSHQASSKPRYTVAIQMYHVEQPYSAPRAQEGHLDCSQPMSFAMPRHMLCAPCAMRLFSRMAVVPCLLEMDP